METMNYFNRFLTCVYKVPSPPNSNKNFARSICFGVVNDSNSYEDIVRKLSERIRISIICLREIKKRTPKIREIFEESDIKIYYITLSQPENNQDVLQEFGKYITFGKKGWLRIGCTKYEIDFDKAIELEKELLWKYINPES